MSLLFTLRSNANVRGFLTLLFAFWLLVQGSAWGQSPLTNGGVHSGTLATAGASESWNFSANAGDSLMVRVGATNFTPRIRVFDPGNVAIAETTSGNSFTRDGWVTLDAPSSGTYTVIVSATVAGQTGSYGLHFAKAPGAFTVSPGDQGGDVVSGSANGASLTLGDLDLWSFTAAAGDALMLRVGATNFTPWLRLYDSTGALVGETTSGNSSARDGVIATRATNAGSYTLVVSAVYAGQAGSYGVSLVKAPGTQTISNGDEGGPIENGSLRPAGLALGDLDPWTFAANAGDSLMLRVGAVGFTPWLRLIGPDGILVAETISGNSFARDGVLATKATNSGTYTLVVSATVGGQSGTYNVSFVKAPSELTISLGDEGGPLTNGVAQTAHLALGDLDGWSFTAGAGDGLMIRVGADTLTPWLRLYGPDGTLVGETISGNSFARDGSITAKATNAGNYTLVVSATVPGQEGNYLLTLAHSPADFVVSPGDQGGTFTNGVTHLGELPIGDLDLWGFTANGGESVVFRVGATNFTPWMRLYGPDGILVGESIAGNSFARDGTLAMTATNAGPYTLVVSAAVGGQTGGYAVYFAQIPGQFTQSPGDDGGGLLNGATNISTLNLGDLDVWTFHGTPGDSNVLRVLATNFTPWIRLYGPTGALLAETTSGNSFTRSGSVSWEVSLDGTYTVVVAATVGGQSGTYAFKQSRWAPDLNVPETTRLDEGATLNVSITAQDPDEPVKPLQFKLLSGPPGATLSLAGSTNATITWPTSEADGPSTNLFTATVTDVVNGRSFVRTNSFTVIVNEINVAPALQLPANLSVDELTPLANVSASATDIDLPPNPRTFSLVTPPTGMTIDPATGAISWTPSEEQGPGSYPIVVVVTDDSPSAINAQHLSTTNTFTVTVREVNLPPVASAVNDQAIDEGKPFSQAIVATDPDRPLNGLTYALAAPPQGMTINPTSGVINWQPSESQGPSTNTIAVEVTDSSPDAVNEKQLVTRTSFKLVVNEVNSAPVLATIQPQLVDELATLTVTNSATDSDLPANTLTYSLAGAPPGAQISPSGVITWTPTEAQGPTNVTFVTIASDNGTPQLSVTNTFQVAVQEVNTAPTFTLPTEIQKVDELKSFTLKVEAADADLPANPVTLRLVAPPEGMTIDGTGAITWTPTEPQGPASYTITVVATDTNSAAAVTQLSTTNTFKIDVAEINVAPVIADIGAQTVHFGTPLALKPVITDADLPANTLTISLVGAPAGLNFDAATGTINWTPVEAQVGTYTVTLKVVDNGTPALTTTKAIQVNVTGSGSRLTIEQLPNNLARLTITGDAGHDYELQKSADLVTWQVLVRVPLHGDPFTQIEQLTTPHQFYRLKLLQ